MHPAPSVILFSSLSGMGFGLLAWLGSALVELVPGALPVLHGIFSALQRHAGVFFGGARHL